MINSYISEFDFPKILKNVKFLHSRINPTFSQMGQIELLVLVSPYQLYKPSTFLD